MHDPELIPTREWVKALVVVGALVAFVVIALVVVVYPGLLCGCQTRPA